MKLGVILQLIFVIFPMIFISVVSGQMKEHFEDMKKKVKNKAPY